MHAMRLLVVLFPLLCSGACLHGRRIAAAPPPLPPRSAEPTRAKTSCDACRGVFAVHGVAEVESCNCRTPDSGKVCRDGADCQGSCLADEQRFQVLEKGPPARGFYLGRCSEFKTAFGCFKFIPTGVAAKGPQRQEDAAEDLCVD
jgi:hypothetical protein